MAERLNLLAIALAVSILTTPAVAEDRWRTFKDLSPDWVWDFKTVRLEGPYILVWTLSPVIEAQREYRRSIGSEWAPDWVFARERLMIDCKNLRVKFLSIINLDAEGVPLSQDYYQAKDQEWYEVGPDTIMEAKMDTICGYYRR